MIFSNYRERGKGVDASIEECFKYKVQIYKKERTKSMNNSTKFKSGEKICAVTKMPNFLLKIKGKLDSRKGSSVPDAYIDKLKRKCESIENIEVITAENILVGDRKNAAVAVCNIAESQKALENKPAKTEGNSPKAIRENRRRANQISSTESSIKSGHSALINAFQNIVSTETVLKERITNTRKKTSEKINVYVSGVRSWKLKEYSPDFDFLDDAFETYKNSHFEEDKIIRETIESMHIKEGSADDTD